MPRKKMAADGSEPQRGLDPAYDQQSPQGPLSFPGPSGEASGAGMAGNLADLRYRHKKFQKMAKSTSPSPPPASSSGAGSASEVPVNGSGRYVCPYCQMACAKPSVLQKHVRAHTNERPYPCRPCGFAFKTKSNLYKHCRSRTHAIKAGEPDGAHLEDEAMDEGSDEDGPQRPYKPRFQGQSLAPGSPEFLQRHISKIISENQAIVDTIDPLWSRRYHKNLSGPAASEQKAAGRSPDGAKASRLAHALTRPKEEGAEPLNLSVSSPQRQRVEDLSNGLLRISPSKLLLAADIHHPQNPEGSIIKDLLLKARQGADVAELLSSSELHSLEPTTPSDSGPSYVCERCRISYRNLENLEIHQRYYCKAMIESLKKGNQLRADAAKLVAAIELAALSSPPPFPSPGPLLGSTPLVSGYNDPPATKRPRLSSDERPPSTTSLRSLEELSRSPRPMQMFGGKVHINDGHEPKTMIIDPCRPSTGSSLLPEQQSSGCGRTSPITISRCNLNSGGTIVQMSTVASTTTTSSNCSNTLVPDQQIMAAVARPIIPKISAPSLAPSLHPPNLAYPHQVTSSIRQTVSSELGIITIVHGGREIPYVPGIPGPQSLIDSRPLDLVCAAAAKPDIPSKAPQSTPPPALQLSKVAAVAEQTAMSSRALKQTEMDVTEDSGGAVKPKFLRPTSLPLKPGTFAPKRPLLTSLAGTTLVSPETPRPRKSYGQLYLNGHAYTYLGLKCSTRVFYCCLTQPQPMYVPQSTDPKLSMYSNWRVLSPSSETPEPPPAQAMALYDSRHRPTKFTIANTRPQPLAVTHSSQWDESKKSSDSSSDSSSQSDSRNFKESPSGESLPKRVKIFAGGFESNEEYTYVRGRGRGKYVCEECGIRCKKPSMLKKHIRTHTDVRPFTCKHCSFSFKTKGNLTKHMKSKAHFKKCMEMGIIPVPTVVDESNIDEESLLRQQALRVERGDGPDSETEEEDEDDDDEDDDDDDDMVSGSESYVDAGQREAACSLLSLAEQHLGPIPISARPSTYPYSSGPTSGISSTRTPTITSVSAHSEREKVTHNTGLVAPEPKSMAATSTAGSSGERYYFPSQRDETSTKLEDSTPPPMDLSRPAPATPSTPTAAELLSALCSEQRLRSGVGPMAAPADMLQAYLTERALQDVRIKQHQMQQWRSLPMEAVSSATTPLASPAPSLLTPTLATNMSAMLLNSPMKEVVGLAEPPQHTPHPVISQHQSKPEAWSSAGLMAQQQHAAAASAVNAAAAAAASSQSSSSNSSKPKAEFMPPASGPGTNYGSMTEDGKSQCVICNKVFSKPSQLRLHVNIHYFERPFRCESCAVSFRTKGHLQKHERSVSHQNKVSMNSTFGMPTTDNPRPFKCEDCKIAFRIHGHLAKHLRSKMHIMKLECLGKLPFGTYAEMERSGVNLNEIDTTDCDNSLESLQMLAQRIYDKDPSKLQQWDRRRTTSESSEDMADESSDMCATPGQSQKSQGSEDRLKQRAVSASDYDDCSEGEPAFPFQDAGHETLCYKCPICEQVFASVNSLKVHIFVDHNAPTEAAVPPDHRLKGRPDSVGAVQPAFRCNVCGLHLPTEEILRQHMATHTMPRPFVCKHCDAGFTSKTNLLQHLALHQSGATLNNPLVAPN